MARLTGQGAADETMNEMVSPLARCLRGCALAVAVTLLTGCTRVILGAVHPVQSGADLLRFRWRTY